MLKNLKIYIYDIKRDKNISTVDDYKYGVEKLFIHLLDKSRFKTEVSSIYVFIFTPILSSFQRDHIDVMEHRKLPGNCNHGNGIS